MKYPTFDEHLAEKMANPEFAKKFNEGYENFKQEYYDNLSSNSTLSDSADYTDIPTNTSTNKKGGRKLLVLE